MGKKGKYRQVEEQEAPRKKAVLTQEQLMDKSHMDKTEYTPLLPSESLYPPLVYDKYSEAALQKIVTDLNYLLYTSFKEFWATVLYSPSFKHCLNSCLSYLHRRWLNTYIYSRQNEAEFETDENNQNNRNVIKDENVYEYTEGLTQVVLLIYHRIVSFNKENKELSDLYKMPEEISKKFILDIPKLFQLCELYGNTNSDIVRYIVNTYANTVDGFYKEVTTVALPILFKKIEDTIRGVKTLTEREQYGINYSYKRLAGQKLSQGEEQLQKKVSCMMDFLGFSQAINSVIWYFPKECVDFCYFNSQVQLLYQNIFLQLQVAYKVWDYQTQETKLLGMINGVLKQCVDYFIRYFERCNQIVVKKTKKVSTLDAYILSLQRIFKDFGRRMTQSRKNSTRSLLLYKIIQKQFDLHSMLHEIYKNEQDYESLQFNIDYLKDIIIAFDNQFKQQYLDQEEPRQEEIEEETQAEAVDQADIEEPEPNQNEESQEASQENDKVQDKAADKGELKEMQFLVPKRMRSEDYYQKLYADYNNKFYKGEYDDDYDEIADHDKRPLAYLESSSEDDSEDQNRLVSNMQYLDHIKSVHSGRFETNRQDLRKKNVNQPKFGRVDPNSQSHQSKKYTPREQPLQEQGKRKYVAKHEEKPREGGRQDEGQAVPGGERVQYRQRQGQGSTPEKHGGQGYKKSNKSYNYKPKDKQDNNDKGKNSNKNKEYRQKRYK